MEVTGLAVGIIGLYSTCQSCYNLYSDVRNAETTALMAARKLETHQSILKAWAFYWEITPHPRIAEHGGDQKERMSDKLKQYLSKYPNKAVGIVNVLYCISDALSNEQQLLDKYGLEVNLDKVSTAGRDEPGARKFRSFKDLGDDLKRKTSAITSRITFTRRFAWALKDGAKFETLIDELKDYNDSLHLLSPEWAFELLQLSLVLEYLPRLEASDLSQMRQEPSSTTVNPPGAVSKTAATGVGATGDAQLGADVEGPDGLHSDSPSQRGLRVLADLADFKIQAATSGRDRSLSPEEETELLSIDKNDLDLGQSGMAVCLSKRETVYIERHSFESSDEALSQRIRTNILRLGRLLQVPACSKHLHMLELLGLVDFPDEEEIGFVFRLPSGLGQHRRGFPVEDMNIRKPRATLFSRDGDPSPTLGWRFELARKLVQSVAYLHASGWLHKNIRTSELFFFPKSGPKLSRDYESMDFGSPFLLGYRYSRPDDVRDQQPPQTGARSPLSFDELPQPVTVQSQEPQLSPIPRQEPPQLRVEELTLGENPLRRRPHVRFAKGFTDSESGSEDDRVPAISTETHRISLDLTHHPSKLAKPDRRYCHAFDVYSLGIALLEIGAWKPIETILGREVEDIEPDEDPFRTRWQLIRVTERVLPHICGEIYSKVVTACLNIDPEESEIGLAEQRELCMRIATDLAQCQA